MLLLRTITHGGREERSAWTGRAAMGQEALRCLSRERPHHTDRTVRREGVNEKRENVQICTVERCLMCESLTNKRRELLVVRRARPGGRTQAVGGRMHIARGTAAHLAEEARLAYAR